MIDRLSTYALEIVSGVLLVSLMAVTGIDVIGRYLLNKPLTGAFELTEMMLSALVFSALPLVSRSGGHVEVDLLTTKLPNSVQQILNKAVSLLCALVLVFFAWRLWELGSQQWHDGARSESLHVPYVVFAWFGAICCALSAAFSVAREFRK